MLRESGEPLQSPDARPKRRWSRGFVARQLVAAGLLVVFLALIAGYALLTQPARVRRMAQNYLSEFLGGPVHVGHASLGIFDGLRLDDVEVRVDNENRPDSVLFQARSFLLSIDPAALLTGKIRATRIVVVDPHARLVEDVAGGTWNFQRLRPKVNVGGGKTLSGKPPPLPEVLVRNARVDYARLDGGALSDAGAVSVEGQLVPAIGRDRYVFNLQTRAEAGAGDVLGDVGPTLQGSVSLDDRKVIAALHDLQFGGDVAAVLPAKVRGLLARLGVTGRLDVPAFSLYQRPDGRPGFRVEVALNDVTLAVPAETWLTDDEARSLAADGELHPVRLDDVDGTLVFTEDDVTVQTLDGKVENMPLRVTGHLGGYSADSPVRVSVASPPGTKVYIPPNPRYVESLPKQVREIFHRFSPTGYGQVQVSLSREPGKRPVASGRLDIIDGSFAFDEFPYPLRRATGALVFGYNEKLKRDELSIKGLRGRGIAGGPNADATINVNGLIAPLDRYAGFDVTISGNDVTGTPAVLASLPAPVREVLARFDADGKGLMPTFAGGFRCNVVRPPGPDQHWTFDTDLDLRRAAGKFAGFPYPLEDVTGRLEIRGRTVRLLNVSGRHGGATVAIGGKVEWGPPVGLYEMPPGLKDVRPDLTIAATGVPIDDDLLAALPAGRRVWLDKLGVKGLLDAAGTVTTGDANSAVNFDLDVAMKDGRIKPDGGPFEVKSVGGHLRLTPQRVVMSDLTGTRDGASLTLDGRITTPAEKGDHPVLDLVGAAKNLAFDAPLRGILPAAAQAGWDAVSPTGRADVGFRLTAAVGDRPRDGLAGAPTYAVMIEPKQMGATPAFLPLPLTAATGRVEITPGHVDLTDLAARYLDSPLALSGTGTLAPTPTASAVWALKLSAKNVDMTETVRAAMPPAVGGFLKSLAVKGKISADFAKLRVALPPAREESGKPAADPDVDLDVSLAADGASLDLGPSATDVHGKIDLAASWRAGSLRELSGTADVASLTLAGLATTDLKAVLRKSADSPVIRVGDLRGHVAGGTAAGQVDFTLPAGPTDASARYAAALVVRDADVKTVTGEIAPAGGTPIDGKLTASLNLEGKWSDPAARRGRGDVLVEGKSLYKIPFLLGLTQIANLSLPINTPFSEATSRYSVDGKKVAFESIELRAKGMVMQGSGWLNFDTSQVRLTFTTDNPEWPTMPVIGDLIAGAKRELLKIHVRGTLQKPEVSASTLRTVTTTVDEVLKGNDE